MSNSKSTDHWNVLARLLGAAPADAEIPAEAEIPTEADAEVLAEAPVEETGMPETPPSADLFWEKPSAERVSEPGPTTEVAAVVEPVRTEISVPAKPAPKAAPASKPSKPKANHWRELASSLGIEVPEPEPEPEPEAAPVIAEIDNPMVREAPSIPTRAPEYRERAEHGPRSKTAYQEPSRTPRAERGFDAGVRTRSEPRQGSRRASLFEDPDLSLDTPGVLDSIFDEIEPETAADSPPAVDQQPEEIREVREDRRERAEKFVPRERELDLVFEDEPAEEGEEEVEEVEAVATDRGESETPRDADEEDRPGRRRKRRRRRGGRRDQKPAAEETQGEAAEEGFEEDEEPIERRSDATDIRERRPVAQSEELEDLEDEADDHLEDDEEDEEGGSDRLRLKHKKIPTWEQAIDAIVAVNMESRAKNPGGGAGRGRGRRWRR